MWVIFFLFLWYSHISASVQCEDCSHNDKSFPAIPSIPGFIGPKWFGLQPPNNLGLGHTTISDTWILICFTIYSYRNNYTIKTTNFSVSFIFQYFSSLSTKHNGHHNHHNHGRHRQKWPPCAPHEALHSAPTHRFDGRQPSKLADVFLGGGLRVCMALKALLCSSNDASPQHRSVLRAIHTLNSPKNYSCLLGGCRPSIRRIGLECKASCGALGGHFRQWRPWSAMVVLVDVGRWRLTSDQPTVGIVTIVYGSNFLYS